MVRLERQKLVVPVARVVEHPTTVVQELPEVGRLRHLRAKSYLTTALAQLFPDHFKLLLAQQDTTKKKMFSPVRQPGQPVRKSLRKSLRIYRKQAARNTIVVVAWNVIVQQLEWNRGFVLGGILPLVCDEQDKIAYHGTAVYCCASK